MSKMFDYIAGTTKGEVARLEAEREHALGYLGLELEEGQKMRDALALAVDMLMQHEPPDSRAVSDECVALASVSAGDTSEPVMRVIRAALASRLNHPSQDMPK